MVDGDLDIGAVRQTHRMISRIAWGYTPTVAELNELRGLRDEINGYLDYLNPPAKAEVKDGK